MIKVENIEVWGFEHAIRGMRNPLNSWDKSDSIKCYANRNCPGICKNNSCGLCVGDADLDLMKRLFKAGTEHRKYLRQIFVSMDIVAPLYWWKEFDTYKFVLPDPAHVDSNSCSTMHKIAAKKFEIDDFSREHLFNECNEEMTPEYYDAEGYIFSPMSGLEILIHILNACRGRYLETKDKKWWWQMIQLLPSSYNQRRTITMDYENVFSIIKQRSGHKLDEWNEFVKILKTLPYVMEIGGMNDKGGNEDE